MTLKSGFFILVLFSIFIFLFSNCESDDNKNYVTMNDSTEVLKGKIIKVNFVDKGGFVHDDIFSYFFKNETGQIFIKIQEGNVSGETIESHFNKEIKVRAIKKNGLWDTDDPNVQSRVGEYIVFLEIL